jgi:hypothetical protein
MTHRTLAAAAAAATAALLCPAGAHLPAAVTSGQDCVAKANLGKPTHAVYKLLRCYVLQARTFLQPSLLGKTALIEKP